MARANPGRAVFGTLWLLVCLQISAEASPLEGERSGHAQLLLVGDAPLRQRGLGSNTVPVAVRTRRLRPPCRLLCKTTSGSAVWQ